MQSGIEPAIDGQALAARDKRGRGGKCMRLQSRTLLGTRRRVSSAGKVTGCCANLFILPIIEKMRDNIFSGSTLLRGMLRACTTLLRLNTGRCAAPYQLEDSLMATEMKTGRGLRCVFDRFAVPA
jgi:hypothetical protein